jgi:hypothetical protein
MQEIAGPLEETQTTVKAISGQLADLKDDDAVGEVFSLIVSLEERAKALEQSHDQATISLAARSCRRCPLRGTILRSCPARRGWWRN